MKRIVVISALVALSLFTLFVLSKGIAQEFNVNVHRHDPYKQFKFRVKWDGKYIPGIFRVSGLLRKTAVVSTRKGGAQSVFQQSPGQTTYEPIILERGRTHDTSFEQWANKVWNFGADAGSEVSLKDFRKNIIIELYNEAGQTVMAFKVFQCWPSEYSALKELDAHSQDIAVESLKLEHEGWQRDDEVKEPTEPSFTEPK